MPVVSEVKIEEDVKPILQASTPQTMPNYEMSFGTTPYNYNMLFYGRMFYP